MSAARLDPAPLFARLDLDPTAVREGRVPAARLAALLGGPEGRALAAALAAVPSREVAAALVALEPAVADRGVRKEIRRTLYRLRQRGVAVPEPAPAAPAPRAATPAPEGLVSHFDGRGDRVIWLLRPLEVGGTLLLAAQVNEPEGLRDLHVAEVGRKQMRAGRARLEREARLRLVAADWRTLDALLVEAHERAGAPDRRRDYLRVRPRLTAEPPAAPAEPVSTRVAPLAADEAGALAAAEPGPLLEEPELQSWWPAPEAAAPFLEELAEARESPLVLSELQQQDRVRAVLRRAARTLFPAPVLARRLAGTAYVLAETGRPAAARHALAVARALAERPEEAQDGPFVSALVGRALGELLAAATARREEERRTSLVVTPGEFLRARSSSRLARSRG